MTKKDEDALAQFEGAGYSIDEMRSHQASTGKRYPWVKLEEGDTLIRILPGKPFYYETGYHYINGTSIYCPDYSGAEDNKCPICQYAWSFWRKFNEDGKQDKRLEKEWKELMATPQYLCNVLIRDEKGDRQVVLQLGKKIIDAIVKWSYDPDIGDVTHFRNGRDLVATRQGKGAFTKYSVTYKPKVSLLAGSENDTENASKLIQDALERRKDLASLITYPSYEYVLGVVQELKAAKVAEPKVDSTKESEREEKAEQEEGKLTREQILAQIDQRMEAAAAAEG